MRYQQVYALLILGQEKGKRIKFLGLHMGKAKKR
jgi:hypothetical protein